MQTEEQFKINSMISDVFYLYKHSKGIVMSEEALYTKLKRANNMNFNDARDAINDIYYQLRDQKIDQNLLEALEICNEEEKEIAAMFLYNYICSEVL